MPQRSSSRLAELVESRLGWAELRSRLGRLRVPGAPRLPWYLFGGLVLFLLGVQLITGVLLLLYYQPGPTAYDSVQQLQQWVDFGAQVRALHVWGARACLLALVVHGGVAFFCGAYRKPRELTWWSGLTLLCVLTLFTFSGRLLPMDTLGYYATKIGLDTVASVPLLGSTMALLAQAGPAVGSHTVQRFFVLHIAVLPLVTVLVLLLHLYLVHRHGLAPPPGELAGRDAGTGSSMALWPEFLQLESLVWLAALILLAVVACLAGADLGPKADPLTPAPAAIHPEWIFMALYQAVRLGGRVFSGYAGEAVVWLWCLACMLGVVAVPFVDHDTASSRRRLVVRIVGVLVSGIAVLLTVWGYLSVAARM